MMEAVRTSETSVDNHFTRQYTPEDNSEQQTVNMGLNIERNEDLRLEPKESASSMNGNYKYLMN
jgi:hypothetical protein